MSVEGRVRRSLTIRSENPVSGMSLMVRMVKGHTPARQTLRARYGLASAMETCPCK